ncbi:MAG: flavodoxin domain-containing protein [Candidatus Aminicenantes bacterium]|nr:MAG: flavodoxin domain-containing protein [Candidatus Aminicenantes bacterium]
MLKVLICYHSRTGNTEKMAEKIAGVLNDEGLKVNTKKVEDTNIEELLDYECLIFGSPTYYGSMAWPLKKLLDESVKYHRKLQGKVGGAFSSAANVGGGNETTILNIINALLIHGMVVQGEPIGDHYGPVSIGPPDQRALKSCERYAQSIGTLVKRLFS